MIVRTSETDQDIFEGLEVDEQTKSDLVAYVKVRTCVLYTTVLRCESCL